MMWTSADTYFFYFFFHHVYVFICLMTQTSLAQLKQTHFVRCILQCIYFSENTVLINLHFTANELPPPPPIHRKNTPIVTI